MPKTLTQKFFIKAGFSIAVINSPETFLANQLVPLPANTRVSTALGLASYDLQIYFLNTKEEASIILSEAKPTMKPDAYLWLCYPKGGIKAKIMTNLNRDILWKIAISHGYQAIHQISIDDIWSAVRFRIED